MIMCRPCAPQVKHNLHGWVKHFNGQVESVRARNRCALRDLPLGQIARGLLGRPNVDPKGPTRIEIAPPLLDTDTKSHVDMINIIAHLDRMYVEAVAEAGRSGATRDDGLSPEPDLMHLVRIDVSDGQSFKLEGHQKRKNPRAHRNRVPVDGPMHA